MEQHILFALGIGLLIGLCLGAVTVWLVLRKSAEVAVTGAKSESQVEITRLNERASSGAAELDQVRSKPLGMRIKHARPEGRGDGPLHKVARDKLGGTGLLASPQAD